MTQALLEDTPELSIVIVNYNGIHFLAECFASIRAHCADLRYEVILVDNASTDGSADLVAAAYPWVLLIRSERNLGFTGGNNLGARAARGRLLLLLNNDTCLIESLQPLVTAFAAPELGVIGPRLVYGDRRLQVSVGYEHTPLRVVLSWVGLSKQVQLSTLFRRNETGAAYYSGSHPTVDWISGACLMTRIELWQGLGGLDEDFFMYCEDVDFCHRARSAGYRVAYSADVTVVHYEGGGKAWIGESAVRRTFRSYLLYVQKHYGTIARAAMALPLALVMAGRGALHGLQAIWVGDLDRRAIAKQKRKTFLGVAMFVATTWNLAKQRGRA